MVLSQWDWYCYWSLLLFPAPLATCKVKGPGRRSADMRGTCHSAFVFCRRKLVYINQNVFYLYNINFIPKITAAQKQRWNNWDRWQTRFQMKRKASASFRLTDIFTHVFPLFQIGKKKNTAHGALSIILKETDPRSVFCLKCKFAVTWKSFEVLQKLWRIHTEEKWAMHVSPIFGKNSD